MGSNLVSKKKPKPQKKKCSPAGQLFIAGRTELNSNPHRESTSVVRFSDPAETLSSCSTKLRQESAIVATWTTTSGKFLFIYYFYFYFYCYLKVFIRIFATSDCSPITQLKDSAAKLGVIIQYQSLVCYSFTLFPCSPSSSVHFVAVGLVKTSAARHIKRQVWVLTHAL